MGRFVQADRSQPFLLPPDLREWLPADDLAHFVLEAVERVPLERFKVNVRNSGSEQYHPQMMLALLIYCYANGIFSSRRIERASYRDVGVRYITANCHPDHDTIAMQIGGIGGLAPNRRSDLARLGLRAVLGGTLATMMTATIAGVLTTLAS